MRLPNSEGFLGKYDHVSEAVLLGAQAKGAIVIVLGGHKGNGFSVSVTDSDLLLKVPEILEAVAQNIREQHRSSFFDDSFKTAPGEERPT